MRCFYMFKGLPGCGKSTKAKELVDSNPDSCHIVERDSIREFFGFMGQPFSRDNEQKVTEEQERVLNEIMSVGDDDVISSDTNFNPKCEKLYRELCEKYGYEFIIKDMTDVPIETCIYQDAKRTGYKCVGEKVIRDMAARYNVGVTEVKQQKNRGPIPVTDPQPMSINLPACIIVDIDGTVAKHGKRSPYDESKVLEDAPRPSVIFVIKALSYVMHTVVESPLKIFFFSGRTEGCRNNTEAWLVDANKADMEKEIYNWQLEMRKVGDSRKDSIVKSELFDKFVRGKYNCIGIFDDRPQVIEECWLPKGLTVFNVGDGSIF